ncbi:hypothetical protein QTG56_26105 (plasmid) [Rossellomorea sp. AcN35-11]|nr:hypothetical protein [Rossellomorea aquimaris]WJV32091.1 hypothetical protein QTG56_26105 [Rossellomorea sp. AcN35-11]
MSKEIIRMAVEIYGDLESCQWLREHHSLDEDIRISCFIEGSSREISRINSEDGKLQDRLKKNIRLIKEKGILEEVIQTARILEDSHKTEFLDV